jgi:peptidylprolyl isomerase
MLELNCAMKHAVLTLLMAASAVAASAQTPASPAVAKPAEAKPTAAADTSANPEDIPAHLADIRCKPFKTCVLDVPPGIPPANVNLETAFTLHYQDIEIGAGAVAEPGDRYTFHYTGWIAADGTKFDSTYDHRRVVMDKDGKPAKDANGKNKLGPPEPFSFTEGEGRVIPGLDLGIEGMRVGGKRRIVIPYQLAYGARGRRGPNAAHPGVPPKADLIFDVDLLEVTDENSPKQPLPSANAPKSATHATPAVLKAAPAPTTAVQQPPK